MWTSARGVGLSRPMRSAKQSVSTYWNKSATPNIKDESQKIVPCLADESIYIASESTIYLILRDHQMLTAPCSRQTGNPCTTRPKTLAAQVFNQVWIWDISYLPTTVRGTFFHLYLIPDLFSRKIVGWQIHDTECAQCVKFDRRHASALS